MNNNNRGNNNNNRRRGRGNNRPQGGGGGRGEQLNRIDSRARGNAPQLLEKYRKLAQDAHLNGDRVTAEYYLQFADHYFRVIADTRQRQDEQRQRRDERFADDDADEFEFAADNEFSPFDQPGPVRREERRPTREDAPAGADQGRSELGRSDQGRSEPDRLEPGRDEPTEAEPGFEAAAGNPFTRDNRKVRALPPRRERRPRQENGEAAAPARVRTPEERHGIDEAVIPPAIGSVLEGAPAVEGSPGVEGEALQPPSAEATAPAPRRRGRRPKATSDDAGPLEAVNG